MKLQEQLTNTAAVRAALRDDDAYVLATVARPASGDGYYYERVFDVRQRRGTLQVRLRSDGAWVTPLGVWRA